MNSPHAAGSDIPTTWTREQVEQLVEDEGIRYQRIELPYGIVTSGKDRSATAAQLFPDDLTGKTVLDIGCNHGFICHEAARRGAARVVGIDIEESMIRGARRIADCLGYDIEFRVGDMEREPIEEQFDFVVCLNVMHHFLNPLSVLDNLRRSTRERLMIETPNCASNDRRKMGLRRLAARFLDRFPIMFAAPCGTTGGHFVPKFVFTPSAIRNILTMHRHEFASVRKVPSQFKNREMVRCDKRRIEHLVMLGGLPGVGKSHLIDQIESGAANDIAESLGTRSGAFQSTNAQRLQRITDAEVDTLLVHYSILMPYNHKRTYETDEFLGVVDCAQRITFATVWAPGEIYRRQLKETKIDATTVNGVFKGMQRNIDLLDEVQDEARLVEYYEKWFAYTQSRGDNVVLMRNPDGDGYTQATLAEWRAAVGAA